jgi:hypothetical protein
MKAALFLVSTAVLVVSAPAAPAGAVPQAPKVVHRATDPATGAQVRVSQSVSGDLGFEIAAPGLTLTKRAEGGRVITVVRTSRDQVTIEADRSSVTVIGRGGRAQATASNPGGLKTARALVAGSPAAAEAARLLGRIALGQYAPLNLTILSTRAMLLDAVGDSSGRDALLSAVEALRSAPALRRVGWQSSPTDCWEKYTKEAIAAYREFEDCLKDSNFWEDFGCGVLYDLRAIGAMTWWMKCVAIS